MSVLREPAFWYGLIVGIILTLTLLLVGAAYIHHRLTKED